MTETDRMRLDEALVATGLAPSRSRARDMVLRGAVSVDGATDSKPARKVGRSQKLEVDDPAARYVSRAALKLIAGLDAFHFDPGGRDALDLGASTGGFTQVLLERGAAHVIAVDVGHGQIDAAVAADPSVCSLEGLNTRDLAAEHLDGRHIDAVVADVSFISLRLALPPALELAQPGAWGVFLVKPQFEVGRALIAKGGIVRDAAAASRAAESLAAWLEDEHGWSVVGLLPSPISGGDGNREFLLGARRG
ncbi:MAG: TlyA family RNA methyltransferase [Pseudomonadota bacterium]|nr:TlyA family RNA methyltransferase [Pseudomonadota bacterium]